MKFKEVWKLVEEYTEAHEDLEDYYAGEKEMRRYRDATTKLKKALKEIYEQD